jgi:hypothetical protein
VLLALVSISNKYILDKYLKCIVRGRKLFFRDYIVWQKLFFLSGGACTFRYYSFGWASPNPS